MEWSSGPVCDNGFRDRDRFSSGPNACTAVQQDNRWNLRLLLVQRNPVSVERLSFDASIPPFDRPETADTTLLAKYGGNMYDTSGRQVSVMPTEADLAATRQSVEGRMAGEE